MWVKVVKAIHEEKALIVCSLPIGSSSIHINILKATSKLSEKGLDLSFAKRRLVMVLLIYFGRICGLVVLL